MIYGEKNIRLCRMFKFIQIYIFFNHIEDIYKRYRIKFNLIKLICMISLRVSSPLLNILVY